MTKFKNKKTKKVIEENLIFYIEKLRKSPNFEEVKETTKNKEEETTPQNKGEVTPQN